MRNSLKIILAALLVYAVLLLSLIAAESTAEGSTIHTLWDAVWFSIETVTTVGYGDISPVSTAGKVISSFFALCSIGILSALIGVAVSLVNGSFLPRLRLRLLREKTWFVFSEENAVSRPLASGLSTQGVVIFQSGDADPSVTGRSIFRLRLTSQQLFALKGVKSGAGSPDGLHFFLVREDPAVNAAQALRLAASGVPVHCCMDTDPGFPAANIHCFSISDCLGRSYWKQFPMQRAESTVVLIGCGQYGAALLTRALLTNVFEPGRPIAYHVFEDTAQFRYLHHTLADALSGGEDDLLRFYDSPWQSHPDLLRTADRILFCFDRERENYNACCALQQSFVTAGRIFACIDGVLPGVTPFGALNQILTPDLVLRQDLDRLAMRMNDVYNASSDHPVAWEALTPFARASNVAAADHLPVKVRYLLQDDTLTDIGPVQLRRAYAVYRTRYAQNRDEMEELEHRRWMRFHMMYNWQYCAERNNALRQHPLLVPFAELSDQEKRKDDFAWEIIDELAKGE